MRSPDWLAHSQESNRTELIRHLPKRIENRRSRLREIEHRSLFELLNGFRFLIHFGAENINIWINIIRYSEIFESLPEYLWNHVYDSDNIKYRRYDNLEQRNQIIYLNEQCSSCIQVRHIAHTDPIWIVAICHQRSQTDDWQWQRSEPANDHIKLNRKLENAMLSYLQPIFSRQLNLSPIFSSKFEIAAYIVAKI